MTSKFIDKLNINNHQFNIHSLNSLEKEIPFVNLFRFPTEFY